MAETTDSLTELLRRTTDEFGWLQPLLDDPDSAAVLGAEIEVFARLGPAVDHNGAQATISGASGGQVGTSVITASRSATGTSGTLPSGYLFADARGVQAASTVAVTVGGGTSQISIPVATLRKTELINTEDDPLFAIDPASAIIPDGSGGILFAPGDLFHDGARVVATTNQALTGLPTIDGVALGNADRVLLTGQTDPTQNGLWAVAAGAWSRTIDLLTSADFLPGLLVPVLQGSTHAGQLWQLVSPGPYVVGTTPLAFGHVGSTATVFRTFGPSSPIDGGAADYLSVHGSERGLLRQPNETTEAYRQRIRNIPDVVSPIAVAISTQSAAQQLGLPPILVLEPIDDHASAALRLQYGLGFFGTAFADSDFLDDPGGLIVVDRRMATNYFEVQLQDLLTDTSGFMLFLDDDAYFDDPVLGYPDLSPLLPPGIVAALFSLWQDIYQKRAGGVNFDILLLGPTTVVGQGSSSANVATKVFDLAPAGGQIWWVDDGFAGHDCASIANAAAVSHFIVYDLEDGSHLTTPAYARQDTQRLPIPTQRVTGIHGWVTSDGTGVGHLVAWFDVRAVST